MLFEICSILDRSCIHDREPKLLEGYLLGRSLYYCSHVSTVKSCFAVHVACFLQVYDRDGNQLAHFVKGDPYLKVSCAYGGCKILRMKHTVLL